MGKVWDAKFGSDWRWTVRWMAEVPVALVVVVDVVVRVISERGRRVG